MHRLLRVAPVLVLCSACASLPAQPGYHVTRFSSEPPGAIVRVAGLSCITPCSLALPPGQHPASIESSATNRDFVVAAGKDGNGIVGTFQLAVGNTIHATGTVLNTVGEVGIEAMRSVRVVGGEAEAAFFLTFGLVSIGSSAVGKVMIKTGQAIVDSTEPRPTEVHVVLNQSR